MTECKYEYPEFIAKLNDYGDRVDSWEAIATLKDSHETISRSFDYLHEAQAYLVDELGMDAEDAEDAAYVAYDETQDEIVASLDWGEILAE